MSGAQTAASSRTRLWSLGSAVFGLAAIAFCVAALASQWSTASNDIRNADIAPLIGAFFSTALAMSLLGYAWWHAMILFGVRRQRREALAWYFAGELGKYLPGGIWAVAGRGELALRSGVPRTTGYLTTLICYLAMVVGAGITCGALAPVLALDGEGIGKAAWLLLLLLPAGLVVVHPWVSDRILRFAERKLKRDLGLASRPWSVMLGVIARSVPTWMLVGTAATLIADALSYDVSPARVAFAAVAAWIIGFLTPVPAGAGVREVAFVALAGLGAAEAVTVAAIARLLFIVVDCSGGVAGLWFVKRWAGVGSSQSPEEVSDEPR